jgi:hypothetical protein
VPRFVILLLSVLLLAAPAGTIAETCDASCLIDEAVVFHTPVVTTPVARRVQLPSADTELPTSPALSSIFRPPRSAFV